MNSVGAYNRRALGNYTTTSTYKVVSVSLIAHQLVKARKEERCEISVFHDSCGSISRLRIGPIGSKDCRWWSTGRSAGGDPLRELPRNTRRIPWSTTRNWPRDVSGRSGRITSRSKSLRSRRATWKRPLGSLIQEPMMEILHGAFMSLRPRLSFPDGRTGR